MKKSKTRSFLSIKKPWTGGNGSTVYLGIPADIVKQLQISENSYLMIDLIDDSIVVIKKHNPQFTKAEVNKVVGHQNDTEKKPIVIKEELEEEFKNPLDDLDL